MAMQIQFDTLAGAQVEVAGQLSTIVRTGLITDVPGNATSDRRFSSARLRRFSIREYRDTLESNPVSQTYPA
jgi:hypothetical protein